MSALVRAAVRPRPPVRRERTGAARCGAGRLAGQRHPDDAERHAADGLGEQYGGSLQPGHPRQLERPGPTARRAPREDRLQRWFDTSAFSQPAAFTFGNAGATFPLLRTDTVRNLDLSVFKHFGLPHGDAPPGAHRGVQRAQSGAVRFAQHERHVELVRRRHLAGQHAAPAAVRPEGALVEGTRYAIASSVTFCTRQLVISPISSSFSLRQSMELARPNCFGSLPAEPNLPTTLPSSCTL